MKKKVGSKKSSTSDFSCITSCISASVIMTCVVCTLVPFMFAYVVSGIVMRTTFYEAFIKDVRPGNLKLVQLNSENKDTLGGFFSRMKYTKDPREEFGIEFEDVEFERNQEKGVMIRGWYIPSKQKTDKAIVLLHGAFVDRREMSKHIPYLHKEAYNLLVIDASDHGISDSMEHRGVSMGIREHQDLITSIDFLQREKKMKKFALFGVSNGGASSIMAGGVDSRISVVIAENPYSSRIEQIKESLHEAIYKGSWGNIRPEQQNKLVAFILGFLRKYVALDWLFYLTAQVAEWRMNDYKTVHFFQPIDKVRDIGPRGLLLMHSEDDSLVFHYHSKRLYEESDQQNTKFWSVKGAPHSQLHNFYQQEYEKRVLDMLKTYLTD